MKFIGCDLGGTNLRAGIVDPATGEVTHLSVIPTLAREGHSAVMQRMAVLFDQLVAAARLSGQEVMGIGIGVPGVLDLEHGLTVFLPNLAGTWPGVPLQATLEGLTGLPVALLNDARAITYGEWRLGAGRGCETMACFTLGTGIGGGLIVNRKLQLGFGGTGGELGHTTIDYNGPRCGCGNQGCIEAYASGPAITAMGLKAVTQGLTTCLGALVDYDLNKITPKVIAQAAMQGDAIAQEIFALAGFYLGIAAGNICASIGPQKIVYAGGVARAGDLLLEPIRQTLKSRVRIMPVDQVEIVPSALGDNAGVIGVATWAMEHVNP